MYALIRMSMTDDLADMVMAYFSSKEEIECAEYWFNQYNPLMNYYISLEV